MERSARRLCVAMMFWRRPTWALDRLWPAVHSRAIEAAVKITTDLLPPGVTSPVVLNTSESGAAVLCAAWPGVAVLGSEVAA
jgi:hypothetical protein